MKAGKWLQVFLLVVVLNHVAKGQENVTYSLHGYPFPIVLPNTWTRPRPPGDYPHNFYLNRLNGREGDELKLIVNEGRGEQDPGWTLEKINKWKNIYGADKAVMRRINGHRYLFVYFPPNVHRFGAEMREDKSLLVMFFEGELLFEVWLKQTVGLKYSQDLESVLVELLRHRPPLEATKPLGISAKSK